MAKDEKKIILACEVCLSRNYTTHGSKNRNKRLELKKYCPKCGNAVTDAPAADRITMKCRECGGVMTMDNEGDILSCPYCGSKELIRSSDTVSVEKIKQQTEFKKWEREDLKEAQKKKEQQN